MRFWFGALFCVFLFVVRTRLFCVVGSLLGRLLVCSTRMLLLLRVLVFLGGWRVLLLIVLFRRLLLVLRLVGILSLFFLHLFSFFKGNFFKFVL